MRVITHVGVYRTKDYKTHLAVTKDGSPPSAATIIAEKTPKRKVVSSEKDAIFKVGEITETVTSTILDGENYGLTPNFVIETEVLG